MIEYMDMILEQRMNRDATKWKDFALVGACTHKDTGENLELN